MLIDSIPENTEDIQLNIQSTDPELVPMNVVSLTDDFGQKINHEKDIDEYEFPPKYQFLLATPEKKKKRFVVKINHKDGFIIEIFPPAAVGIMSGMIISTIFIPSLLFFYVPICTATIFGFALEYLELNEVELSEEE